MSFPTIDLEHESVWRFLTAAMRGRIPALLFTGPDGVGKEVTAVDFARRLSCERETPCALDGEMCDSCHNTLRLEHPGIEIVYGTPTMGTAEKMGDDAPEIAKVLDEKRQDMFAVYDFKKKPSIRVARARYIIQRAHSKPFNGRYNVFIINDAHTMREEAQNALLKLVEEPPEHSVIVFITSAPDAILYTIRSRCQRVRFGPLKPHVVESLLITGYEVPQSAAKKAAGLAQGNIRRAVAIAGDIDDDERAAAYDILHGLADAPDSWIIQQATILSRGASRDRVARFLHEFALACRDMMADDPKVFINQDRAKEIRAEQSHWRVGELPRVVDNIVRTRDEILRRNLNSEAALVDLFMEMQKARV